MIPIIMFQAWYSTKRITGVLRWKWHTQFRHNFTLMVNAKDLGKPRTSAFIPAKSPHPYLITHNHSKEKMGLLKWDLNEFLFKTKRLGSSWRKLSSPSSHNFKMKSHSPLTSYFLMKESNSLPEKYFVSKIWSTLQKLSQILVSC